MSDWLFDLGNSRFKAARRRPDGGIGEVLAWPHGAEAMASGDDAGQVPLPRGRRAWVASVAATALTTRVMALLRERFEEVQVARTLAECGDLRLAYPQPQRMGVDRFLALLAARAGGGDVLVAGVGTALTIDLLDADGIHHGGRIAASPTLMRQALQQRAVQLPASGGHYREFADDTEDALASGCDGAAVALRRATAADLSALVALLADDQPKGAASKAFRSYNAEKSRSLRSLFVVDAMIGQDAVTTANAFREGVGFTGVVLTKLDGDARGGAALSVREVTGQPIMFASAGEKLEDFDVFHPDRMASRILGMGDVLTLIEQAEQVFDAEQAEATAAKIGSGELTLEDFLEQMLAIRKMGPIGNLLGMLPGAGQMKDALAAVDDSQLDRVQAIIRGMTPQERADPKIINASRRLRIANGSGVTVAEVNQLVDRFFEARKMMSQMAGQMGMPFGRKNSRKAGKGKNKQAGKKKGGRGPTPPKNRNPLGAGMPGMPAGFPDLSNMPKGLDELPPGLADIDLSKLKFPKN